MLSRTLMPNSTFCCKAMATLARRLSTSKRRTSVPSMHTRPPSGSNRRVSNPINVLLPEPVGPTTAVTVPAAAAKLTSRSTGRSGA